MKNKKSELINRLLPHHSEETRGLILNNYCKNIEYNNETGEIEFLYDLIRSLFRNSETMIAYDVLHSVYNYKYEIGSQSELVEIYSALDEKNQKYLKSLKQLEGQILQNLHLYEKAIEIYEDLIKLIPDGLIEEETQSNYASTLKSYSGQLDENNKIKFIQKAFQLYLDVYNQDKTKYWSGINAAFLALLSGNMELARRIVKEVFDYCQQQIARMDEPDFWLFGTLAESQLIGYMVGIQYSHNEIFDIYDRVKKLSSSWQELQSVRKNLLLLRDENINQKELDLINQILDEYIPVDSICIFSGHRIDEESRQPPRFPPENISSIQNKITSYIQENSIGISYSSLSNGSDIIFVEIMKSLEKRANVVIPYDLDQFRERSVRVGSGSEEVIDWVKRFNQIEMDEYVQLWIASIARIYEELEEVHYHYANQIILGLAILKARELRTKIKMLVVWDGEKSEYTGGTAYFASYAQQLGYQVDCIHPASAEISSLKVEKAEKSDVTRADEYFKTAVFADVAGFSKFTELQVKRFFDVFYSRLAEVIDECSVPPLEANTWGDGLYFVFSSVVEAGDFSLRVCEMLEKYNESGYWKQHDLPAKLEIRISMHCGPVQSVYDPIVRKESYTGSHVSFTARIEPITPANMVYASLGAAAISTLDASAKFYCEYVGTAPLAKKYGACQLFAVRRKGR